jgi:hypothetical protein
MRQLEDSNEAVRAETTGHPWFKLRAARLLYVVAVHEAQQAHQNGGDARSILEAAYSHAPIFQLDRENPAPRLQNRQSAKWKHVRTQLAAEHLQGLRSALEYSKSTGRELSPPSDDCYTFPTGNRTIWVVIPRKALALAQKALAKEVQAVRSRAS